MQRFAQLSAIFFAVGHSAVGQQPREIAVPPLLIKPQDHIFIVRREEKLLNCVLDTENKDLKLERIVWWKNEVEITDPDFEGRLGEVEWVSDRLRLLPARQVGAWDGSFQCSALLRGLPGEDPDRLPTLFSAPLRLMSAEIDKFPSRYEQLDLLDSQDVVVAHQGEVAFIPCASLPSSTPDPPYVWFERRLQDTSGRKTFLEIETDKKRFLVTSRGLQMAVVQPEDAGRYRCLARNTVTGKVRRSKLWLDLQVKSRGAETSQSRADHGRLVFPRPDAGRIELAKPLGARVLLDCVAGLGGQIRWEKQAKGSDKWLDVGPIKGVSQIWGNLELEALTPTDAGLYRCSAVPPVSGDEPDASRPPELLADASESWRAPSAEYSLSVLRPPQARLELAEGAGAAVDRSESTVVKCAMAQDSGAVPRLMLDGKKLETVMIAGSKQNGFTILDFSVDVNNGTVTHQARIGHPMPSGIFQCLLENPDRESPFPSGSAASAWVAAVAGEEEPELTTAAPAVIGVRIRMGPADATRSIGQSLTLLCQVSPPSARVAWLKDGKSLDTESSIRHRMFGSGTLSIDDLRASDAGSYVCAATGVDGDEARTPPAKLTLLQESAEFGGLQSIVLGEEPLDSYEEDAEEADYDAGDIWNLSYETSAPTTTTRAQVIPTPAPELEEGSGQTPVTELPTTTTTTTTTTTPMPPPTPPPVDIPPPMVFEVPRNFSFVLEWIIPASLRHSRDILHFRIQQKMQPGSEDGDTRWETLSHVVSPYLRNYTVHKLEPRQSYKFRIGLVFADGESQLSAASPYHQVTPPGKLPPVHTPKITSIRSISPWELEVGWDFPVEERAVVEGFRLSYAVFYGADNVGKEQTMSVEGGETRRARLGKLLSATPYQISLRALNSAGESPISAPAKGYTLKEAPKIVPDGAAVLIPTTEMSEAPAMPSAHDEAVVFLSLDSTTLLILGGILLVLLILGCVICMVCCTIRDRKEKELTKAAKGKFLDASQRIFREQSFRRPDDGQKQGAALYAVRESGLYDDEYQACLEAQPHMPAVYAPKPGTTATLPYASSASRSPSRHQSQSLMRSTGGYGTVNLYNNPMDAPDAPPPLMFGSYEARDESSEPEHAQRIPYHGYAEEDELGSGGDRQGSTPECDLPLVDDGLHDRSRPYSYGADGLDLPPPPSHFVVAGPSVAYGAVPLNTSGATESSVEFGRGSVHSSRSSASNPLRSRTPNLLPPQDRQKGATSPLIPQSDWDVMWSRGGVSPPSGSSSLARSKGGHPSIRSGGILSDPSASPGHLNTFGKASSPLPPPPPLYQAPPCVTIHDRPT